MGDERAASEIDRRIGARLRAVRNARGMSQQSLANRLGVTFQQIQKYESGVSRISAGRLYEISVALELDIGYLYQDAAGAARATANRALKSPNREAAELISLFSTIEDKLVRQRVIELIRAMSRDR